MQTSPPEYLHWADRGVSASYELHQADLSEGVSQSAGVLLKMQQAQVGPKAEERSSKQDFT